MDSLSNDLFGRARRCGYYRGRYYNCNTSTYRWSSWGRWVLAGAAILVFILIVLMCCCMARRRRKRNTKPIYGTGWMAPTGGSSGGKFGKFGAFGKKNNHNSGYYAGTPQQTTYAPPPGNPPPAYGNNEAQYTGTTNANEGYYGNNNGQYNSGQYNNGPYDSNVQPPPNVYQHPK